MTSDVNYIDIFFNFLTGAIRKFSAWLSKFGVLIKNWPACFEKASFFYAVFTVSYFPFLSQSTALIMILTGRKITTQPFIYTNNYLAK